MGPQPKPVFNKCKECGVGRLVLKLINVYLMIMGLQRIGNASRRQCDD